MQPRRSTAPHAREPSSAQDVKPLLVIALAEKVLRCMLVQHYSGLSLNPGKIAARRHIPV